MPSDPLIRVRSGRALRRLKAVTTDVQWYFQVGGSNSFATVPAEHLEAALAIPGITRARPKGRVHKCWTW